MSTEAQTSDDEATVPGAHERTFSVYDEQRRAFHVHAAVFAAATTLIFVVNLLTNLAAGIGGEWSAWWSVWVLLGWGTGIAVHGLVVRLARPAGHTAHREPPPIAEVHT